jgi:N-acetyl-gamma-glutamyl-phosphate reductase
MGGEFRFRDPALYERWYGERHEAAELTRRAVYGLPELYRERIASADMIGNPGCYPTGALLGLLPLVRAGLVEPRRVIVNAVSGVSGAGRTYSQRAENLFLSCYENVRAYSVGTHRHAPEIEQALADAAGIEAGEAEVVFVPHMAPMDRGILTTIYARPAEGATAERVRAALREFGETEPFVRARESVEAVRTASVRATNFADVSAALIERGSTVVIVTAIDNTVKGAGGQAVENMNVMFGLAETAGLLNPGT